MTDEAPLGARGRITATGWAHYPCIFCGEKVAASPGPDDPTYLKVRFRDGTDDFEEWSAGVHGACFRKAAPHFGTLVERLTIRRPLSD